MAIRIRHFSLPFRFTAINPPPVKRSQIFVNSDIIQRQSFPRISRPPSWNHSITNFNGNSFKISVARVLSEHTSLPFELFRVRVSNLIGIKDRSWSPATRNNLWLSPNVRRNALCCTRIACRSVEHAKFFEKQTCFSRRKQNGGNGDGTDPSKKGIFHR